MNRQLKFRAWNNEQKKFEYFELFNITVPVRLLTQNKFPVQQWTGEYDKNNTPIYEGDIVKCERPEIWLQEEFNERAAGIIMYFNAAFHVTEKYTGQPIKGSCSLMDYRSLTDPYLLVCEVIGNVYENEK